MTSSNEIHSHIQTPVSILQRKLFCKLNQVKMLLPTIVVPPDAGGNTNAPNRPKLPMFEVWCPQHTSSMCLPPLSYCDEGTFMLVQQSQTSASRQGNTKSSRDCSQCSCRQIFSATSRPPITPQ